MFSVCREGERFMHSGRTQEVDQAMRGAFSLHHISLIHFLVEWVKLPVKRNVGQPGRLSEQRAAGKQTNHTQRDQTAKNWATISTKMPSKKHRNCFLSAV